MSSIRLETQHSWNKLEPYFFHQSSIIKGNLSPLGELYFSQVLGRLRGTQAIWPPGKTRTRSHQDSDGLSATHLP